MRAWCRLLVLVTLAAFLAVPAGAQTSRPLPAPPPLGAAALATMTTAQKAEFLLRARVVQHGSLGKGTTKPSKLTLSDGTFTHHAVFQSIDTTLQKQQFVNGRIEMYFRDSYHYNIAAYGLAELLGLGDMVPVTVERSWSGRKGSLSWWVDWRWDEVMRRKEKAEPPPELAVSYSNQLHLSRVFGQLVYDTDRNQTNTLISADWKLYMVDFSRAFRTSDKLQYPDSIQRCSRDLLARLEALTRESVMEAVGGHLEPMEITGLMGRRDQLVERIRTLVRERGEAVVLF
jgi:hypothetical protein